MILSGGINLKKWLCLLVIAVLLCGCSPEETLETVNDEWLMDVMAPQKELSVKLPNEAAKNVLAAEDGAELYFCDGYVIAVQTAPAGDLSKTLRNLCGYDRQQLTLMETGQVGAKRYDWTWTSAGEGAVQVGRGAVLDDGDYHYCVTVMADEGSAGALASQWDTLFDSMVLRY
jgi:hypothetical protein